MMETAREPLAEVIRRTIRSSGRTAYTIATASGVSQAILSRFMTGKRGITLETADKLCRVLRLELSQAIST